MDRFAGYDRRMMLRFTNRATRAAVVFPAILSVFLFLTVKQASHAPGLHAKAPVVEAVAHSHDHGDHSRDDWEITEDGFGETDHHHPDHTHEKAGLVAVAHLAREVTRSPARRAADRDGPEEPPYGIDRPPRSMT